MELDAPNRAFDRLRDFELVQRGEASRLEPDQRTAAMHEAITNLRAYLEISDEAAGVFHRRFDSFLEEFGGEKPPYEFSVWGFVGFMLALMATEETGESD